MVPVLRGFGGVELPVLEVRRRGNHALCRSVQFGITVRRNTEEPLLRDARPDLPRERANRTHTFVDLSDDRVVARILINPAGSGGKPLPEVMRMIGSHS